jgi:hypothetical protein
MTLCSAVCGRLHSLKPLGTEPSFSSAVGASVLSAGVVVADLIFIVLIIGVFAVLALVLRGVERL